MARIRQESDSTNQDITFQDGDSDSSIYPRGLEAMGLGELSSILQRHKGEAALAGFLGLSYVLAACSAESRPTQREAQDAVVDQPPTLSVEMNGQGEEATSMPESQATAIPFVGTEVPTGEPSATAEVVVTSTPAVTVDQGIPLERFDGNNGEPNIRWRDEVAGDFISYLAVTGVLVEGGAERVEVMRDVDDNGVFRWMPFVEIKTEEGNTIFTGHLGQTVDEETGELKDELKGVCEVNVDKLMENGIIESEDQLQLDVNYSEDDQGIKIPRYAVKKNGESLMGCTDLRLGVDDRSLFVAFPDRLLAQDPPLVPDFPALPEGVLTWVPVFDGKTRQWLLMENIGGDPSFVFLGEEWPKVQSFSAVDGDLVRWNEEGWVYEPQPIPEEIAASLGESAIIEGVEEGEDGRWSVIVDGEVKFFVSEEEGEVVVLPLPTATLVPTLPPPPPTLVPTLPPPPPTLVPTEVPPTPELGDVPFPVAGQLPSIEQIANYCKGRFPEAPVIEAVSDANGWPFGVVEGIGMDGNMSIRVKGADYSVTDVTVVSIRQIIDPQRYVEGWQDAFVHFEGVPYTIHDVYNVLPGTHVWKNPLNDSESWFMIYCPAVRP